MKIYIPSKGRSTAIKTHIMFERNEIDYRIILHNEEEAKLYRNNSTIDPKKLIVSGAPLGITNQRNWICKNLAKRGEWYISLDDNISGFTGVHPDHYEKKSLDVQARFFDKKIYDYQFGAVEFLRRIEKDMEYCQENAIFYCGFATVPNYYFLGKKYRHVGYVISKAVGIRYMGLDYDTNLEAMEDYGFLAENLKQYGRVLINNFLIPVAGHYEPGGIGTYEDRLPRKISDCEYLMKKYPGLFRYKRKANCHPLAELQVRFTSEKQVVEWRKKSYESV